MSSENLNVNVDVKLRIQSDVLIVFSSRNRNITAEFSCLWLSGVSRPSGGPASWTLWFKGRWVIARPAFLREREEIWLAGKKPKFFIGAFTLYVLTVNQTNLF